MDGDPTPTKKQSHNAIYFSKKQFNAGLHFPIPLLFKQFLHYTKILLAFLHPNVVKVLMGCNILDMFFHLDLFLLEFLFVYTIKMSWKGIFSLFAHIPFLQLVTGLPDSNKGRVWGYILVSSP